MQIKRRHKRKYLLVGPTSDSTFTVTSSNLQLLRALAVDCHRDGHREVVEQGGKYLLHMPSASDLLEHAVQELFTTLYREVPEAAALALSNNFDDKLTLSVIYGSSPKSLAKVNLQVGMALQSFEVTLLHGRR